MAFAECDQLSRKFQQLLLGFIKIPIKPADLVVLTVGVVVSALRTADFIAATDHRHALGEQKGEQQIAFLALSYRVNVRIVGGTFNAIIPGMIIVGAVLIVFAIRFVVLFVVAKPGRAE